MNPPPDSLHTAPAMPPLLPDSTATVLPTDSIAPLPADTLPAGEHLSAILLTPPPPPDDHTTPQYTPLADGTSWVILGLVLVFTTVCLRFRNNSRYMHALWRDLTEVRRRQNLFDETVRETSFLLLLNLLWCASAGVLLHAAVVWTWNHHLNPFDSAPPLPQHQAAATALCIACAVAYTLFMATFYTVAGNVFADRHSTRMWVKGYAAAQGLAAFAFFPLALLCEVYPADNEPFLLIAAAVLAIAKIAFLWKGLRIFFNQFSSWVLFLYYLCSVEIVPLVLTYLAATALCALFL